MSIYAVEYKILNPQGLERHCGFLSYFKAWWVYCLCFSSTLPTYRQRVLERFELVLEKWGLNHHFILHFVEVCIIALRVGKEFLVRTLFYYFAFI